MLREGMCHFVVGCPPVYSTMKKQFLQQQSLWNVSVTSIRNFTFLPSCTMLQWLTSMDFELLLLNFCRCSDPRVYALYDDSPWYRSLFPHSSVQDIE